MERFPEMSFSAIRAVTFDVGGTLIEPWPSVGQVYAEIAMRFGTTGIAPEALNRQFAVAWQARRRFDYSRSSWRELVNQTFAGAGAEPPGLACFDAIYQHFATPFPWRLFEDVLPALAALKARGFKLGVVSNWDERLRPLLQELQLDVHFDALVISHETSCAKPAPEIFRRAARALNIPPQSILHIGDSPTEDVAGAKAAGMNAVLLDRKAARSTFAVAHDLRSLAALLDKPIASARSD